MSPFERPRDTLHDAPPDTLASRDTIAPTYSAGDTLPPRSNEAVPPGCSTHADAARLAAALCAVRGAGAALLAIRGRTGKGVEIGDQLKTAVDRAAEGWVLGYLEGAYPTDEFLAEERFDQTGSWAARDTYWTVDALDGTRSYIDGFDGFCVQVALVRGGVPVLAAIDEPAEGITWAALRGHGAHVLAADEWSRVPERVVPGWPPGPRFIDSTSPKGPVGDLMARRRGRFVECGSIGVKAVRVARGDADVFAKDLRFKLWDVAPADLVLRETGCRLGTWDGAAIPYLGSEVAMRGILAAPAGLFERAAEELRGR